MQLANENHPLIIIVGPTAVGKTEVSINLAEHFNGEIISADSRLFYRGMDIGTAKPTKEELKRVRHHLIDVSNPDEVWSLVKFQEATYQVINDVLRRGKIPFLVGGTGQYIFSIVEGWEIPEAKPNPELRRILADLAKEVGTEELHKRLDEIDPEAASHIEPQNIRRTIRALEVIMITGKKFSTQRMKTGPRFQSLILGIHRPRPILYDRIDRRIEEMLDNGLVDEVKNLLIQGYSPDLPPLSAIGYQQMIQYLQDEISLDQAVILMKRQTRQYVRRQSNWFKKGDPRIHWFNANPNLQEDMTKLIKEFLLKTA